MRRVALAMDDIGNLPTFRADEKVNDPRYKWFVASHGETCAELDAMNANDLRQRVAQAIAQFVDLESWKRHKSTENAEVETIKKVFARMAVA
jgi:hypothetical protein